MLKLNEAVKYAKTTKRVRKTNLAQMLWPESTSRTARANFSNLISGKNKKIDISAVPIICSELGVSADFLFGLSMEPNGGVNEDMMKAIVENNEKMRRLVEALKVSQPELEEMLSLF